MAAAATKRAPGSARRVSSASTKAAADVARAPERVAPKPDLRATLQRNKLALGGAGVGVVVLLALRARSGSGGAAASLAPPPQRAGLPTYDSVANDVANSLQPQIDALARELANLKPSDPQDALDPAKPVKATRDPKPASSGWSFWTPPARRSSATPVVSSVTGTTAYSVAAPRGATTFYTKEQAATAAGGDRSRVAWDSSTGRYHLV